MHLLSFSEVSDFNFILYVIGLSFFPFSPSGHLHSGHSHLPPLLLHWYARWSPLRPFLAFCHHSSTLFHRSRRTVRGGVSSLPLSHRRNTTRTPRSFSQRKSNPLFHRRSFAASPQASVSRHCSGRCWVPRSDPTPSSLRASSPKAGSRDSSGVTRSLISPFFRHCCLHATENRQRHHASLFRLPSGLSRFWTVFSRSRGRGV